MTTTATQDTETLINMLRAAAADLSPSVINALIARPDAVRGALVATGALLARDEAAGSPHDEVESAGRRTTRSKRSGWSRSRREVPRKSDESSKRAPYRTSRMKRC
jgi:hypothetical protein